MKHKSKFNLLLYSIVLTMIIFAFSACASKNTSISSEDECTEESSSREGRGGELEPIKFTSGELSGQYNPADIRGSSTLGDISKYFEIPLSVLAEAFNIPLEEAENIQNKYYKYIFEGLSGSGKNVGNGSMIVFVSMYKRLPFEIHEPEYLLEPATKILKNLGTLSEQELDYLEEYVVTVEEAGPIPLAGFVPPDDQDDEYQIDGRTTFGDLLNLGISEEQLIKIISNPMPDSNIRVKDYCVENGLPFSDSVKLEIYDILYSLTD